MTYTGPPIRLFVPTDPNMSTRVWIAYMKTQTVYRITTKGGKYESAYALQGLEELVKGGHAVEMRPSALAHMVGSVAG